MAKKKAAAKEAAPAPAPKKVSIADAIDNLESAIASSDEVESMKARGAQFVARLRASFKK